MSQSNSWDPLNSASVFSELFTKMAQNPQNIMAANLDLYREGLSLYQQSVQSLLTGQSAEVDADRRFKHESWQQPAFSAIKDSYQLFANHLKRLVNETEGMDEHTASKADFFTRLIIDALSPSNYLMTNPQALEKAFETKGQSLKEGLQNIMDDMKRGDGQLKISMTDLEAFEMGKNIATTEGKVVYENRMFQLIQYSPLTEESNETPLLIVPPWINKYYILDMQEKNSFVRWMTAQGHSVFIISWINPDETYSDVGFENYVTEGVLEAIDAVQKATSAEKINTVGYCIGGTLLTTALAYMQSNNDDRVQSATFLTTMLDFSDPGELGLFIDEEQLQMIEQKMDEKGYLDGSEMSGTFNLMRANDLIWSFYVNNYLMGNEARPFDLLYWNSDSTRMPAKMHKWYLRNLYLENKLIQPNAFSINGTDIDITSIKTPTMFVSTIDDHIAPWLSTYSGALKFAGPVKFILSGSGHIAGIINPPEANKYGYRVSTRKLTKDAQSWADKATLNEGSWWPEWDKWAEKHAGKKITARVPGDGNLAVIEDAPGRYVAMK